jgi:hypothetical protein
MPLFSVGKQQRDNKSGIFKSHMEHKPMNIRVEHPKFWFWLKNIKICEKWIY